MKEANVTSAVYLNPERYLVDCRLYWALLPEATWLYLNSAYGALLLEIYNRAGLGGGARSLMVEDYAAIPVIDSGTLARHEALPAIELLGSEAGRPMLETPNERWRHSDEIVFDALELTHGERDAVYEAVIALVEARLGKAGSV